MNAAFLLVTTAWLAGADPAPAVAPAAPAAPTAPAASAAPAAPAAPAVTAPSACCGGGCTISSCDCGCEEGILARLRARLRAGFGCGCGCEQACAAPKPVTCSSCSCEKRLHILHSCDICAPKCKAPAKPVCCVPKPVCEPKPVCCVPKPVCEPKPVCTTCSTCGGEHRLLERLRQLFHRDCDTCTTCGTTGCAKAEPIPAPKDGDRKQMPTGQKDVQIVPPGLELSPAGGAF